MLVIFFERPRTAKLVPKVCRILALPQPEENIFSMNKKKSKEIFRFVLAVSAAVITIGFIIATVVIVAHVSIAAGIGTFLF